MATFTSVTVPSVFSKSNGGFVGADTLHPFHLVRIAKLADENVKAEIKAFLTEVVRTPRNAYLVTNERFVYSRDAAEVRKSIKSL